FHVRPDVPVAFERLLCRGTSSNGGRCRRRGNHALEMDGPSAPRRMGVNASAGTRRTWEGMTGMFWKKHGKTNKEEDTSQLRRPRRRTQKRKNAQREETAWEELKRKSQALRHFERIGLLDKAGFYEIKDELSRSTTVQMAGMQLAVSGPPTPQEGLLVGIDAWSMWPVMHDVFTAYNDPRSALSSPNCVVV